MNETCDAPVGKRNIWMRGLFMLLMAFAFQVCVTVLERYGNGAQLILLNELDSVPMNACKNSIGIANAIMKLINDRAIM